MARGNWERKNKNHWTEGKLPGKIAGSWCIWKVSCLWRYAISIVLLNSFKIWNSRRVKPLRCDTRVMKICACKFGCDRRLFWDYRPHTPRKCLIQIWSFSLEASGQKPYSSTQTSWFYCNYWGKKPKRKRTHRPQTGLKEVPNRPGGGPQRA